MKRIRKASKFLAAFLAVNMLGEVFAPMAAYAVTSGPSQPEVQSFEPIGTSEMVDLFTGDFTYNIPLLDIEGYPINISYNSGITMDQEASWVGLGWNISPGVINRNMRGIPDDFNGDLYERELNVKDNITVGITGKAGFENFGLDYEALKKFNASATLDASIGLKYNNYRGVGFETSANLSISSSKEGKGSLTAGLGVSSSDDGLTVSPSVSFSANVNREGKKEKKLGGNVGVSFNRRSGLQSMSFGLSTNMRVRHLMKASGGSSSISFGMPTYSPSIGNQMVNATYTLSTKFGSDIMGQDITGNISAYYSSQRLANPHDEVPAYGYMNLHNAVDQSKVNLDFNRENDGSFNLNTPSLPVTNLTYDVYSVAGQGIGGSYRMFRNDLGYVFDPYQANTNVSGSLGLEAAPGGVFKSGFNVSVTDVNTYTEKWSSNPAAQRLQFRGDAGYDLYEPAYFREAGEKSVDSDPAFYTKTGSDKPVRFKLSRAKDEYGADPVFVDNEGNELTVPTENYRTNRQKRNQAITYLTRGEMKRFGLDDQLKNTYNAPDHHIGQVTTLRPDGARYIFGIAAYNISQEETSFNMGKIKGGSQFPNPSAANGLIRYRSVDNSMENDRGIDHYYSNSKTPPFAHSYLLTAVLSNDYVDVDNVRGPSPDDMGTYTKFSYTKIDQPYKWRTPFEQYQANYNEGSKSDPLDDKANYIYGEKELWYVDKIETKNYVAVFTLEDRDDGYGVKDKNGGRGNVTMKRLQKISLYSRTDYENSGSPVPIKEVHFVYTYELCKNIPNQVNSEQGKLTLSKIYFTYRDSYKAKYNSYNFTYSTQNPDYSLKAQDRWGYYKPNNALTYNASESNVSPTEFPYTVQDQTMEDQFIESWTLKQIELPSGGKINITYESDDYGYVQDKRAMEMFVINNVGSHDQDVDVAPALKQSLTDGNVQEYLFFELKDPVPTSTNLTTYKPTFKRKYLDGINELYFRFLVNVTNENGIDEPQYNNSYEYVSGYSDIAEYGVSPYVTGSEYRYGYVKINKIAISGGSVFKTHEITKAAWNYGKLHIPRHVYRQKDPTSSGVEQLIKALSQKQLIKNVIEFALGTHTVFYGAGYGKQFYRHKSWIRLNSPNEKKLGGGIRVKKIELSDEWGSMVSGQTTVSYGQEYDYTTTNKYDETISSGVAAYEPGLGADENPFKQPIYHGDKKERLLAPDEDQYIEAPIGESFFPSPTVGYSKITVKNLQYANVKRNATGKVVHEFYTAKDFPTITKRTGLEAKPFKTSPIWKLFTFRNKDFMTASQGFVVELNDMHGKEKKKMVYAEDQPEPISGVEYKYQSKPLSENTYQLQNTVTVILPDGRTRPATVGLDYDFVADMRAQTSKTVAPSGSFNLAVIPAIGIPFPVPTSFPGYAEEETRFKSATTTKVIKRSGILEETIAYDLGARVSTNNLAYDSETGEVLLTQTFNQFKDPVYSFSYPAHWYYDGMGQAYKNVGLELQGLTFSSGVASVNNAEQYFVPGDEVMFNQERKLWVSEVSENSVTMINEHGNGHNGTGNIKIIRSGRRNLQSLAIGSITSLTNPIDNLQGNAFAEILQANAVIYTDSWKTFCDCFTEPDINIGILVSDNPYVTGQKGIWRTNRSYLHLSDRSQSYENQNTNIRKDGIFTSFNPFWKWNENAWEPDEENWTWTTTITQFNPNGQELESKDALGRYSAGIYAYNNTLTVGIGANLRYSDIAFDAFEDYSFLPCSQDHFSYRPFIDHIDNENAHTGSNSIRVGSGEVISITKPTVPCEE